MGSARQPLLKLAAEPHLPQDFVRRERQVGELRCDHVTARCRAGAAVLPRDRIPVHVDPVCREVYEPSRGAAELRGYATQ
jgi:hypothetical protein